ncbi:uncharacterized protein N7483_010879 [Penicillium malachiteum]|uniref:uncharacterized protein n=1 Tax=Penicillium malachiteum TaxID=1324776 RepID=UPI002549AF72|nr:uncharacterized protein N7483_010879 [Penicillium malachiteum]KAJ5713698.1 hypothetical protein N7483_010879 [Penicillium malachiteum]
MAVRRSARLRTQASASPDSQESTPQPDAPTRLESVEERDETSNDIQPLRTPVAKKASQKPTFAYSHQKNNETRTPKSTTAVRPSLEEMHPSKAHQSTAKKVDSGLLLGFNPIKKDADGNPVKDNIAENTPSKSKPSPAPTQFGTPGYEFKFAQESQLSDEAKQLMDREKESIETRGERKIAKPRGQAGRFSEVHMAEFKKMDSIAGHASSFRAAPGRFQPETKSLKRTKSKAQLDEPEPQNTSPSRSPSAKRSAVTTPTTTNKRVKRSSASDVTITEPDNHEAKKPEHATPKPAGPRARPRSAIRSSLMTPTRASMARTTSATLSLKAPKTSLIPSLARSPSTHALASPRTPRTEFNPRFKTKIPAMANLKSILRKRQPLFSRDPAKIAAGTHVAAPDFNPDLLFGKTDVAESAPTPSPKKHVEFTPSVKSRHQLTEASPSRSKIPTTPSRSNLSDIVYPTLPALTPEAKATIDEEDCTTPTQSPTIRHVRKSAACNSETAYPELPVVTHGISHGISNKKRRRDDMDDDEAPSAENTENVPPVESRSDERNAKRLKENPPTPSPVKSRPIKTPVRSVSSRMATPTDASAKKRGMLSLSRLNLLSKPKNRA